MTTTTNNHGNDFGVGFLIGVVLIVLLWMLVDSHNTRTRLEQAAAHDSFRLDVGAVTFECRLPGADAPAEAGE